MGESPYPSLHLFSLSLSTIDQLLVHFCTSASFSKFRFFFKVSLLFPCMAKATRDGGRWGGGSRVTTHALALLPPSFPVPPKSRPLLLLLNPINCKSRRSVRKLWLCMALADGAGISSVGTLFFSPFPVPPTHFCFFPLRRERHVITMVLTSTNARARLCNVFLIRCFPPPSPFHQHLVLLRFFFNPRRDGWGACVPTNPLARLPPSFPVPRTSRPLLLLFLNARRRGEGVTTNRQWPTELVLRACARLVRCFSPPPPHLGGHVVALRSLSRRDWSPRLARWGRAWTGHTGKPMRGQGSRGVCVRERAFGPIVGWFWVSYYARIGLR